MSFLHSCYTTPARFFTNSDQEVTLRWYFAEPGAPVLGYPSKIRPLRTVPMPWVAEGVGEVFNAPQPFSRGTRVPFLKYGHVCGTREDFETGGTRDGTLPPVLYNRDGLPVCCVPPFTGQGGAVGGGTATVTVTPGQIYCTNYDAEWVGINTFHLAPVVIDQIWQGSIGGLFVQLQSPLVTVSGHWELTTSFQPGVWTTTEPWDGHGTRVFLNASMPGTVFNVSCV